MSRNYTSQKRNVEHIELLFYIEIVSTEREKVSTMYSFSLQQLC